MKKAATILSTWMISTIFLGGSANAQHYYKFNIDKTHSSVIFKIKNRDLAYMYGRFNDITGVISVDDRRKPKNIEVSAKVNARSIDTNERKRDRHLKGKEFFDTAKKKDITFESKETRILEEEGKYELVGELTLMGNSKPFTLTYEHTGTKNMKNNSFRIGGHATFKIKRSEFGLDAMIPEIADEVEITVSIEAELQRAPAG